MQNLSNSTARLNDEAEIKRRHQPRLLKIRLSNPFSMRFSLRIGPIGSRLFVIAIPALASQLLRRLFSWR